MNPFGSPQGGAFQAPGSSVRPGLFQGFAAQSISGAPGFLQPQAGGSIFGQRTAANHQPATQAGSIFGQPNTANQPAGQSSSIFGQASAASQPGAQGGPIFGQTSTVNQTAGQSSSFFGHANPFNQPATQSGSIFGQSNPVNQPATLSGSIFGQPSKVNPPAAQSGSVFGQPPAQGQTQPMSKAPAFGQLSVGTSSSAPAFGQTPAFGQPSAFGHPSGLGKPPPAFGSPQKAAAPRPGQPPFRQPASSVFSAAQNRGFGPPEFSFRPPNEAVFKPIFSGSPEPPAAIPAPAASGSSQVGSGFSGFSLPGPPLGLGFTPPAASGPSTTAAVGSSKSSSAPRFSFTGPAASEPTTPSSFSFTPNSLSETRPALFSAVNFGSPGFGDTNPKAEIGSDDRDGSPKGPDANVFARLSKAAKRKDDASIGSGPETPPVDQEVASEAASDADSPRHPAKRPVVRPRGPTGGLFGRALSGIRKEQSWPVRREAIKPAPHLEEPEGEEPANMPPPTQALTREAVEKAQGAETPLPPSAPAESPAPGGRAARTDSLDSMGGASPGDLTAIMCRNVPPALNRKDVIEAHFARFGKVCKTVCRPNKNMAVVHFDDHASAAKAKKKGKVLQRHELLLLWQKKKQQSPGQKAGRPPAEQLQPAAEGPKAEEPQPGSSPLRRPALMPPALGGHSPFRQSSPARRPSPAKLPPFDPEPQKEGAAEPPGVPPPLLHLVGQVAETAEDKYRLLEQRDRALRQGRPKRTDLDLSKVFVGTCPDMCPEKERYMRETRNQLSVYELVPDTEMVDHAAAIKEYSRSSADQEEPLPHELRPLPVLGMTMDYLVTQILDQGQDNQRDWYDFVWNRTRGIRKDITQQRLCCPLTVALIEKCTRFHVHCAHHLCEQHMSSFDAKINNENMTKCLQSLKEMYEDLAAQQTHCPREAEFRQYSVLLKLNDGDILREVQQFREEVRKSAEVKFAVQAFAAVSSNNFVRFFKLVKAASYLSGCLLHRYFTQVRSKALKALNMAHTVGPRSTPFPVDDIVRMLMFRSAAEATDFVQQYGLNVNDGLVELSRTAFQEPELPLSLKRSEVILAKKAPLIGQVVNGGPLPYPPHHVPVCSFDAQNRYRGDGPAAEPGAVRALFPAGRSSPPPPPVAEHPKPLRFVPADSAELTAPPCAEAPPPDVPGVTLETGEAFLPALPLFQPIPQPEPVKPPSPPPKPVYSEEDMVAEAESVIEEVVRAEVGAVAEAAAGYVRAALLESGSQVEVLVGEVVEQALQEISAGEIRLEQQRVAEEKRRLEEARRKQEHEAFLVRFSCSLCSEILHQVVDEDVKEIAASEIQEALKEKAERFARCTEQICSSLVEEVLSSSVAELAEDVLEAELERIHKFIKRWRDVVAVRRQLKRQMRSFPAAPCCVDPRFKLRALAPSAPALPSMAALARGLVDLGNGGVLAVSSTRLLQMRRGAAHQMRVHSFYQQLLEEASWKPLDLPALVTENLPNPTERIFWKALLLLPSDHEQEASLVDRVLSDWLEAKLGGNEDVEEQRDGSLRTLCVSNSLQENGQRTHKVHVTVKASKGPLSDGGLSAAEESGELRGASAIIMLLPALPVLELGQEEQDVPLLSALLQLKQMQQISSWSCPLPLVVLVPWQHGAADAHRLEEALQLHPLMEEELISDFMLVFIPDSTSDPQGSQQLSQAVRWLLARAPPPLHLSCRPLVQLVESALSREFCPRVYSNRRNRAAAGLPAQAATPVLRLYNAVLDHLAAAVAHQDLGLLSWPPAEFSRPETREVVPHPGWNSAPHLAWIREVLTRLQLPEWDETPAADSWPRLRSALARYAAQIPASRHGRPLLTSRLENLLERVRLAAGRGLEVPWDDAVLIFIDHRLKDWQPPGAPPSADAVTADGQILVYFPSGSLEGFRPPAEWTQAVDQTHRETQQRGDGATPTPSAPALRQRLFHSWAGPPGGPEPRLDVSQTPTEEERPAQRLLQDLEEEKAESQRSLEQLRRWLEAGPPDVPSPPLLVPSSTLLSSPAALKVATSGQAAASQKPPPEDRGAAAAPRSRLPPIPLGRRLEDLQREIAASREEELACRLTLGGLLSIVDD